MDGVDWKLVERVRGMTERPLTVAGGITSVEEIVRLHEMGCDAQIGMALYTGRLDLAEAFCALVRFGSDGLAPTAVVDEAGRPLMLAYSNRESLLEALRTGKGVFYSRSRRTIWRKGETSGNTQHLLRARLDCDRDAILFVVEQRGVACHNGTYSCFREEPFRLVDLETVLWRRLREATQGDSYTARLANDPTLLSTKIREEAAELAAAQTPNEVRWEAADLLYHALVKVLATGLSFRDVLAELSARRAMDKAQKRLEETE